MHLASLITTIPLVLALAVAESEPSLSRTQLAHEYSGMPLPRQVIGSEDITTGEDITAGEDITVGGDGDPISPVASAAAQGLGTLTTAPPESPTAAATGNAISGTATSTSLPTSGIALSSMGGDPANGGFPGGFPSPLPDVPVSIIFLLLFAFGAFTHISIYRANSARGHKFLLSDLMFDFCMIRTLTSIFRIVWSFTFTSSRGVILFALIFENGGAAVIFAVNLFFAQRIFRSMHPAIGWSLPFTIFSFFLIWSVPLVIIINIISLSVSFFSVGVDKEARLMSAETALRFGASWNVMLSTVPLVTLLVAGLLPAKSKPEKFGEGSLATKAALLAYSSATLGTGAAIRLAANLTPLPATTQEPLYGKALFYTTGFLLEILVVAMYAFFRIDLLFHIPNGASKPGDYSAGDRVKARKTLAELEYDIEERLGFLGVEYETLSGPVTTESGTQMLIAKLYSTKPPLMPETPRSGISDDYDSAEVYIPRRPDRVSRRLTLMDAIETYKPRPTTANGPYIIGPLDPLGLGGPFFSEKDVI